MRPHSRTVAVTVLAVLLLVAPVSAEGETITAEQKETIDRLEWLSNLTFGGVLAGFYQYQVANHGADEGGGAISLQPELGYSLGEAGELFMKFGFALGNALNDETVFNLAPLAAVLEDDVVDINGRNRSYLLTAWYRYVFDFGENHNLGLTGGIVDATDYLDGNAYANDEYTQFMNEALVNGPNGFLPSFDAGGAVEWNLDAFHLNAVIMQVGSNDDGRDWTYIGAEAGLAVDTSLGAGNYRLILSHGSRDFLDQGGNPHHRDSVILSADQELAEGLGIWTRLGWQNDAATVNYDRLYSGGLQLAGSHWDRPDDVFAVGCAYLDGANGGIAHSGVFEAYYNFRINEFLSATADFQYMNDSWKDPDEPDVAGWIFGIRLVVEF